ncbi:MAG TPA: S-layer homology domain-containing protein [Spirochaetia bacterium]|nr:S-layer homology domain-containing protein [Spirochaetia bacterium]
MKKVLALMTVLMLCLTNAPAAFASPATAFYTQFADISQPAWGAQIMQRMIQTGIMQGYQGTGSASNTYYAYPNQPVTRAEFAVLLARSLNLPDSSATPPLADWASVPAWAKPAVATLFNQHVVQGQPGPGGQTYFAGGDYITRAELVAMLERAVGAGGASASGASPFRDVTGQDWFYNYVMTAYQAGIVQGESPGYFAPSGDATRVEVMAMLWRLLTGTKTGLPADTDLISPVQQVNNLVVGVLGGQNKTELAPYLTGDAALGLSSGNFFLLESTPLGNVSQAQISYPAGPPQVVAKSVYLATVASTVELNLSFLGNSPAPVNYQGVVYYRLIKSGSQWLIYAVSFDSQSINGAAPTMVDQNSSQDGGF